MLLKYFSTNNFDINSGFYKGLDKIKNLSKFEKIMTYLWILGPFIFLIERDPADLWLTILSITFLVKCFIKKDWRWSGQLWFIFAFLLWILGIISASLGPYAKHSIIESLIWIRFPLYAAAAQAWLGKDNDIRIVMFVSILLGMLIMCVILFCELIIEPKIRLTWPYGDLVPGSYLSKISLQVYCTLIALFIFQNKITKIIPGIVSLISLVMIFFTGERTNFIIRLFSGLLVFFSWKLKKKFYILIFISTTFLILIFSQIVKNSNSQLFERYTTHFLNHIPIYDTSEKNEYWGAWRSGLQQGLEKPIIGFGPSSSRHHCKTMDPKKPDWLPGKNYCGNHPHNFYFQLFSDTGLVGLFLGSLMFISIIFTCYKSRMSNLNCPLCATAFIVPLALFFPLQQMGNFYGQWSNLFLWFPIGYSLATTQNYKSVFQK